MNHQQHAIVAGSPEAPLHGRTTSFHADERSIIFGRDKRRGAPRGMSDFGPVRSARPDTEPAILSMRCIAAEPSSSFDWHSHPCFEFSFVSDDDATFGYPPGMRAVRRNTLVLYHANERHGGWSGPRQSPRFWVVHFAISHETLALFPGFADPHPDRRVWRLDDEQAETFRWILLQILAERTNPRDLQQSAESAWLSLLLISVHRWVKGDVSGPLRPDVVRPDLVKLWHLVNASVGSPGEHLQRIQTLPNYDSLRHGFKRAFGCSPRRMILRLRVQRAKRLLLETSLSIKAIADRCGYERQHEFTRVFRQHTGVPPTEWRSLPFDRTGTVGDHSAA
jgi:hypothetical protein